MMNNNTKTNRYVERSKYKQSTSRKGKKQNLGLSVQNKFYMKQLLNAKFSYFYNSPVAVLWRKLFFQS